MDKVREILAWMARHHFWLLSGLVVVVGLGVWFVAKGHLAEEYNTNKTKITTTFSNQRNISSKAFLPNDSVNARQKEEITKLAAEVREAWQQLYDRQREEALIWPAQIGQSFRDAMSKRQFGDYIEPNQRQTYTSYITARFNDLPKMINANELVEGGPGGRGFGSRTGRPQRPASGGGPSRNAREMLGEDGLPIEETYTVYWSDEDQERIRSDMDWPAIASHWKIWTTQEDLWVYETLLKAIAATNKDKGGERYSNAAINQLDTIQVGQLAAKESRTRDRIVRPPSSSASSMGEEGAGTGDAVDDEGMDGGEETFSPSADGTLTPDQEKAMLLSRRYINTEGRPIPVPADETPLDPTTFGTEFKQLPVRLDLTMDVRWLSTLMVHLSNAPLKVMITEVRINPDEQGAGGGRGGFGGGQSARRSGGGGFGGGRNEDIQVFESHPHMKRVILQGVVQIFNPPNPTALGEDQEGGDGTELALSP